MCANALSTSSPFASTTRSLLSRITSPLKSRTRNLTDFEIRLLEPHRQYSPGDLVKGAVILTVGKPIRITHLTVCLHGFVRVFKNPNTVSDPLPVDAGLTGSSNSRKSQYFGNGHASLFRDEETLCGEGRLDAGVYEFEFELEFPDKGIPTSIDFERGTISYMITSTITRPTSIAATSSCDHKVSLVETVDIGPMTVPKPRVISLEPISRRKRRRKTTKSKERGSQEATDIGSGNETTTPVVGSPHPDDSASQFGEAEQTNNPRSPVPSEILSTVSAATGTESTTSSSTGMSFRLGPVPSSTKSTSQRGSNAPLTDKTITATIELGKSGCLPGDNIPLKIYIKHTKAIKSMHGIIITFYRQGRIDSAPPLSLFVDIKGKNAERIKHDQYYPKSKTGLGGLSLSSAGSSSLFRKDLAQTFAPILVDPSTLAAVINASVRVPEDVFPTISNVPGEMISFKYYVEVVVDLGGKLAGQQRHVPRLGAVNVHSSSGSGSAGRGDGNNNMLTAWGGSIVDTDHIRREKGVVACLFEVTVGSIDSARKHARGNSIRRQMNDWPEETPHSPGTIHDPIYEEPRAPSDQQPVGQEPPYRYYDEIYDAQYPGQYSNEGYDYAQNYDAYPEQYNPPAHSQIPVPPPEIQAVQGLSEKERARLAEQRLLPSQPPQDVQGPSSSRIVVPPSAPTVITDEGDEDLYGAEDITPQITSAPSQPLSQDDNPPQPTTMPSAPTVEDLSPNHETNITDDKQEIERRRMLAEASAPSNFLADEDDNAGEGSSGAQHEPSAPILNEYEEYGGQYYQNTRPTSSVHHETLPKYER